MRRSTPRARTIRGGRASPSSLFGKTSHSSHRTRQDVIDSAARFARAVTGLSASAEAAELASVCVSFEQLRAYFEACNIFYCRNGDGTRAATSALRTMHNLDSGNGDIATDLASCSYEQLHRYFLETFTKDEKRIDRLEPVVKGILKNSPHTHKPDCRSESFSVSSPSTGNTTLSSVSSLVVSGDGKAQAAEEGKHECNRRIGVEQQTRIQIEEDGADAAVAARLKIIKYVTTEVEQEQRRRIAENKVNQWRSSALSSEILSQLVQKRSKSHATHAAVQEKPQVSTSSKKKQKKKKKKKGK